MKRIIRKIVKYMENTWRNKLMAIIFIALGLASDILLEDATFLVFTLVFGSGLFLVNKDVFEDWA